MGVEGGSVFLSVMAIANPRTYTVHQRSFYNPKNGKTHEKAKAFAECTLKYRMARAGRRGAKTTTIGRIAVDSFLAGRRVLYATPTSDQIQRFWAEITLALAEPIEGGIFKKNESLHTITLQGSDQRIRAKTAWNADTLRGDYCDLLILDEWQLMNEDTWEVVGRPMIMDKNGDAIFVYTPPSLHSRSTTKATDPRHAAKMFKRCQNDPKWGCFHWTSQDNPFISEAGLKEAEEGMSALAYRQEILAEDVDEAPGALWKRSQLDDCRRPQVSDLARVVVGVDPPGGGTEAGIVAVGIGQCDCRGIAETHGFVLEDASLKAAPDLWAREVVATYHARKADRILGERNYGGDMVQTIVRTADKDVRYKDVTATRGKAVRAEPVAALYEQGKVHHVREFPQLEDEMCGWVPGFSKQSPNRMDALVWAITELMLQPKPEWGFV